MNFFKKRYKDMKEQADRFANSKNIPKESYSVFYVLTWIMIASSVMGIITLWFISNIKLPENNFTFLALNMVIPVWAVILFFGLGKYFLYARILEVYYLNKATQKLITKLDMYWWKKYKKHSPLTEGLFKMQTKATSAKRKLSKSQRRLLMFGLIFLVVLYYGWQNLDTFEAINTGIAESEAEAVKINNDLGKIFDGLQYKFNDHT